MSTFLKYLRRPRRANGRDKESHEQEQGEDTISEMQSSCIEDRCSRSCFPVPLRSLVEPSNSMRRERATSTRISRSDFVKSTMDSIFPNTHFTDHESVPPLPEAFSNFIAIYPQYGETQQADEIRNSEYYHLARHVCLDYYGFSLFSHAQMHSALASSSANPLVSGLLQPPFFNVSYKSASLKSQVQSNDQDNVLESAIRTRIMHFLNILDGEYSMVYTASRTTAFRLLAESYPFQETKGLLSVYDYESEAMIAMEESAQRKGAKVMSASFSWPSFKIHSMDDSG